MLHRREGSSPIEGSTRRQDTVRVFFKSERDLYNTLKKYEITGLLGFVLGLGTHLTKDQLHNIYRVSSECLGEYTRSIRNGAFRDTDEHRALVSAAALLGAKYCYNIKSEATEREAIEYLEPLVEEYVKEHNEKISREIKGYKQENLRVAEFLEEHPLGLLSKDIVLAGVLHPQVDLENEYRVLRETLGYNRDEIEGNKRVYGAIRESFLKYMARKNPEALERVNRYIREIERDVKRQDEQNNPKVWEDITLVIDAMAPPEAETKEQLILDPKIRGFLGFDSPMEYVKRHLDLLVSSPPVTLFLGYYFENTRSIREGVERLAMMLGYDGDVERIVSLFEDKIEIEPSELVKPVLARYGAE